MIPSHRVITAIGGVAKSLHRLELKGSKLPTAVERFNETISYLGTISPEMAHAVQVKLTSSVEQVGRTISLEGHGYWNSGKQQHKAVRGLLLCQLAYPSPWVKTKDPWDPADTLTHYRDKSEENVKDAIRCFLAIKNQSATKLADTARRVSIMSGGGERWYQRSRQSNVVGERTCYAAIRTWLFQGGFVSLRWISTVAIDSGFERDPNMVLGMGVEVPPNQIGTIPRGHIFNFHAPTKRAMSHWGVSTGNGKAIACNTTSADMNGNLEVDFQSGNTTYGEFDLASCYAVCRWKYATGMQVETAKRNQTLPPDITIRAIDPTLVTTYF